MMSAIKSAADEHGFTKIQRHSRVSGRVFLIRVISVSSVADLIDIPHSSFFHSAFIIPHSTFESIPFAISSSAFRIAAPAAPRMVL